MAKDVDTEENEAPLDPAMLRVQAKLRRMMLISSLTLGVGLVAVVIAIIYRVSNFDKRATNAAAFSSNLELPAGSTIVSSDVDGERVTVTIETGGGREIHVFEISTGRSLGVARFLMR